MDNGSKNILIKKTIILVITILILLPILIILINFNTDNNKNEYQPPISNIIPGVESETDLLTIDDLYPVSVDLDHIIPLDYFELNGSSVIGIKKEFEEDFSNLVFKNKELIFPYGITAFENIKPIKSTKPYSQIKRIVFPNSVEFFYDK